MSIRAQSAQPVFLQLRDALRLLLAAALFSAAPATQAQVLEEIIVTAQKREQAIQDVGIAITAFSGEQMKALGFERSWEVAAMTPNVHIGGSQAGQNTQFTIRGVTQNDFTDIVEAPIAAYIDDGYIAMAQGQTFALFDMERVEIAKGPQGTLFGRNATGGLVHYVTRKPTREFEGYGEATFGSEDQVRFEGSLGGPLGERVAARLAVLHNQHDELLDNQFPGADDLWNDDTTAVRGHLLFSPNDRVELLVSASYAESTLSESPFQSSATVPIFDALGRVIGAINASPTETREAIGPGGIAVDIPAIDGDFDGLRPVPGGDLFGFVDADGDGFDISKDFASDDIDEFETTTATVNLSWEFDRFTLTAISDFKSFDKFIALDVDAAPAPQSIFQSAADVESFSQELRFNGGNDRLDWVAGLYYLDIDNQTNNALAFPAASPFSSPLIFGVPVDATNLIELKTESVSAFGQIDLRFGDTWTLVAGLRLIEEEKDFSWQQIAFLNTNDETIDLAQPLFPLRAPFADDTSDTLWAGKLQLEWRPSDDLLVYGGINRGVKAGSFNAKLADGIPILDEDIPYDEEELLAYEVGFKRTLGGGTTRLNAAAFYYDYSDYQAFVFIQSSGTVTNRDAEIYGAEFDIVTSPIDGLDLMFGAGWFDATVEDLELGAADPTVPPVLVDVEPSFAPELTLSGLARYEWSVASGTLAAQIDANWSDQFFHNIRNFESQKYDSYFVANARLTWTSPAERWQISGWVQNFTDERYRLIGFDLSTLCGCSEDFYGKPRWYGVTARYAF